MSEIDFARDRLLLAIANVVYFESVSHRGTSAKALELYRATQEMIARYVEPQTLEENQPPVPSSLALFDFIGDVRDHPMTPQALKDEASRLLPNPQLQPQPPEEK